jgi:hypothetical protein
MEFRSFLYSGSHRHGRPKEAHSGRRTAGAGPGGIAEGGVCAVFFQDDFSSSDNEGDSAGVDISRYEDNEKGAVS